MKFQDISSSSLDDDLNYESVNLFIAAATFIETGFNQFVPNARSIRPQFVPYYGFLMFYGGRERVYWEQMG